VIIVKDLRLDLGWQQRVSKLEDANFKMFWKKVQVQDKYVSFER
jgi:hypothetical protein